MTATIGFTCCRAVEGQAKQLSTSGSRFCSRHSSLPLSFTASQRRGQTTRQHRLITTCTTAQPKPAQPTLQGLPALPHVNWAARAIKAYGMAELEARKLKYPTTGTEALLMGILTEGTSVGSRFLRSKGIKLMDLRDETVKLLGKADMFYFSAEHPPLTPQAEAALKWAVDEHQRRGGKGEIPTELMILGIWEQKEAGAGHKLLANLGFTDEMAEELSKLI